MPVSLYSGAWCGREEQQEHKHFELLQLCPRKLLGHL